VEIRTEENYRSRIRNHIQPRWGTTALADITTRTVTMWIKQLRRCYTSSTVAGIITVFSMMLDDAVDEHLIARSASDPSAAGGANNSPSPSNASGLPRSRSCGSPTKPSCVNAHVIS
jgi:hypothetical protein